jgi:hypothetical protein
MADDEQVTPPRRGRRARGTSGGPEPGPEQAGSAEEEDGADDDPDDGGAVPAATAARKAAQHVADFTGRRPESVVSIDRADGGWQVGVEVVETRRIPDTTDVLAVYEVRLDRGGGLRSYRRTRRYSRGQLDERCR